MNTPKDPNDRARLWVALGNQPGVAAWFSVWSLSREPLPRKAPKKNKERSAADACHA